MYMRTGLDSTRIRSGPAETPSRYFAVENFAYSSKSETHSLDAIRDNGISLLGTCVGPRTARHAFLDEHIKLERILIERLPASRSNTPCFSFAFLYSRIFATSNSPYIPPTSQSYGIASTPYCGTACTRFGL